MVNKSEERNQGYRSFEEFREKFYPISSKQQDLPDDPYEFGVKLAQKSLKRLKDLLSQVAEYAISVVPIADPPLVNVADVGYFFRWSE